MVLPRLRYLFQVTLAALAIGLPTPEMAASDQLAEARALNQQAIVLDEQGRYAEAEPIFARALAIREKALGPDHPDVAESLNNFTLTKAATRRPRRCTNAAGRFGKRCSGPTIPTWPPA
jgi:hypothetical protein